MLILLFKAICEHYYFGLDSIIIDGFNVAFCMDRSQLPTLESNDSSVVDLLCIGRTVLRQKVGVQPWRSLPWSKANIAVNGQTGQSRPYHYR